MEAGSAGRLCDVWVSKTSSYLQVPSAFALTAVFSFAVYHAIYLEELTAVELTEKIAQLFSISPHQISQIYKQGPTGIHVLISDEVSFSVLLSYLLYPSL